MPVVVRRYAIRVNVNPGTMDKRMSSDSSKWGLSEIDIARVNLFFTNYEHRSYLCAVLERLISRMAYL